MEYLLNEFTEPITIKSGNARLPGLISIPPQAKGLVIFAHGRGSSRFSTRNQYLAQKLQKENIATLLFDFLTAQESAEDAISSGPSFDLKLLRDRLLEATSAAETKIKTKICYFGLSTGAAAALLASLEKDILAIACCSGRTDLIFDKLPLIKTPTLYLAGGYDFTHLLAKRVFNKLACPKKMVIIPGANALFEGKGKLEKMSKEALQWFKSSFQKNKLKKAYY